jgi:hypothetical protein
MSGSTTGNFSGPVSSGLAHLQSELSRINMLRVRGEFTAAKSSLLLLLKQYPQSLEAHLMMGDVYSELREFTQAVEWYQLSTDLDKSSVVAQTKLRRAQNVIGQASSDANFKPMVQPIALYVVAAIATVAIGSIAFIAGNKNGKSPTNTIVEKIVAPQNVQTTKSPVIPVTGNSRSGFENSGNRLLASSADAVGAFENSRIEDTTKPNSHGSALFASGDRILQEQISARTGFADKIVSVEENPRDHTMTITYQVSTQDHGRYVGACIAVSALSYHLNAISVTLRGIRNGVLMYMSDVPREKVMELEAGENGISLLAAEDHTWIDKVLTNEYKKRDIVQNPTVSGS